jgi:DivIVA domain-containing protein
MEPDIDVRLNTLLERGPQREFARVLRGYDPRQVNEHLQELNRELARQRDQLRALEQRLADVDRVDVHGVDADRLGADRVEADRVDEQDRVDQSERVDKRERRAKLGLASRIEQVLQFAEDQAVELVGAAAAEAEDMKRAAKVEADELRATAEREVAELLANAKQEADEVRASAEREAEKLKQSTAKANAMAEESRRLIIDAKKNAGEIEAQANKLLADAKAEADRIHTDAQREADELSKQKENIFSHLTQISLIVGTPALAGGEQPQSVPNRPASRSDQYVSPPPTQSDANGTTGPDAEEHTSDDQRQD